MNEMYRCINRNARPNNNQLINYYQRVRYLLRMQEYPVNNTYNTNCKDGTFYKKIIPNYKRRIQ